MHAGVESSFCMLLTAHYVMRLLVPSAREATIHPFAHQGLANCRSAADRCRPVTCLSLLAHRGPPPAGGATVVRSVPSAWPHSFPHRQLHRAAPCWGPLQPQGGAASPPKGVAPSARPARPKGYRPRLSGGSASPRREARGRLADRLRPTHPRATLVTFRVPGLPGASAVPVPPPALLRLVSRAFESLAAEPHHAGAWDAVHCALPHVLTATPCTAFHTASHSAGHLLQCTVHSVPCGAPCAAPHDVPCSHAERGHLLPQVLTAFFIDACPDVAQACDQVSTRQGAAAARVVGRSQGRHALLHRGG